MPRTMCSAVLKGIEEVLGIDVDDPDTWSRIGEDLEQAPMWGHQNRWNIRQLPVLHTIDSDMHKDATHNRCTEPRCSCNETTPIRQQDLRAALATR